MVLPVDYICAELKEGMLVSLSGDFWAVGFFREIKGFSGEAREGVKYRIFFATKKRYPPLPESSGSWN